MKKKNLLLGMAVGAMLSLSEYEEVCMINGLMPK